MEGLHGIGIALNRPDCLSAVQVTLDHIMRLVRQDGFLAGRWLEDWAPAVDWACLTGSAQIAGVCLRLHQSRPTSQYVNVATRMLGFLACTQEMRGSTPGTVGGIRGSFPFSGTTASGAFRTGLPSSSPTL